MRSSRSIKSTKSAKSSVSFVSEAASDQDLIKNQNGEKKKNLCAKIVAGNTELFKIESEFEYNLYSSRIRIKIQNTHIVF